MNARRTIAVLAVTGFPILFPLTCAAAAFDTYARALGWREHGTREGTWFWRVWWFYGYRLGLYKLDWWLKRRVYRQRPGLG